MEGLVLVAVVAVVAVLVVRALWRASSSLMVPQAERASTSTSTSASAVKVAVIDEGSIRVRDLRHLPAIRTRIKGSASWVSDSDREVFGGVEYLLVREPDNRFDSNAVAIYGKGRKVGYVSAAKAAVFASLLDALPEDAFRVGGASVADTSIRLWVDLPSVPALRGLVSGM